MGLGNIVDGLRLYPKCMFPECTNPDHVSTPNVDFPKDNLVFLRLITPHSRRVYPGSSAFEGVSRFGIAVFGIMTGQDRCSLGNMYLGKIRRVTK